MSGEVSYVKQAEECSKDTESLDPNGPVKRPAFGLVVVERYLIFAHIKTKDKSVGSQTVRKHIKRKMLHGALLVAPLRMQAETQHSLLWKVSNECVGGEVSAVIRPFVVQEMERYYHCRVLDKIHCTFHGIADHASVQTQLGGHSYSFRRGVYLRNPLGILVTRVGQGKLSNVEEAQSKQALEDQVGEFLDKAVGVGVKRREAPSPEGPFKGWPITMRLLGGDHQQTELNPGNGGMTHKFEFVAEDAGKTDYHRKEGFKW
ncbi:hypothetical protein BJV78DRAFT_1151049 [Lactifluus subvellereus]|nr:hypothetical protein BJV78DRAFT_1151049 [Lactifluus subvellereus]